MIPLTACYNTLPSITSTGISRTPEEKLSYICNHYNVQDCNGLSKKWKSLLVNLIASYSPKLASMHPADFWAYQLSQTDIAVDNVIRDILERILATAFTSSDAERAFSIVSSLKTPDRSSLSPSTLESLVRIQFNGPEVLSEENLFEYTKEYVKVSSRVDDDTVNRGMAKKSDTSYTTKSTIF